MASDFGDDSGEKMLNDFTRFAERMGEDAMRRRADEFRRACKNAKSATKGGRTAEAKPSEWAKLDMREFQGIEGYDELKPIIDGKLDAHGADHTWFTDPKTGKEYLLFRIRDAHEVWNSFDELSKESAEAEKRASQHLKREVEKTRAGRSEKATEKPIEHPATEKQVSFVAALHDKGVISDEEMKSLGDNPTVEDANELLNRHRKDAGYLELRKSRSAERDERPLDIRAKEATEASKRMEQSRSRSRARARKPRKREDRAK